MISLALSSSRSKVLDYLELAKLRLVSLVLLSTAVGFFLGSPGSPDMAALGMVLFGTALVAAGSMSLNQWMEREEDALMNRTASRPLPAMKLQPKEAFWFGTLLAAGGILVLCVGVNAISSLLAAFTLFSYLLFYTPMKKSSSFCTLVGAVPGAVPPLIGWAAAARHLSLEAWIFFAILFLWQMPHFFAIAWFCRKDYAAAGFKMLSVEDPGGGKISRQILFYTLALVPVSLLPSVVGLTGPFYLAAALGAGGLLILLAVKGLGRIEDLAFPIFRGSILYLAFLLLCMVLDKRAF